mgnify:CR=1 FL=1
MNSAPDFRYARREDTPLILQFILDLAEYEQLRHEVVTDEDTLRTWIFERHGAEVLIAQEGDEPVGFALYFHNFSTFLGRPGIYLEDLFVWPECRGRGYGKALLAYLAALAKREGCGRLEWWCLDWNRPSIDFYKSLDARPMDEWTVYRLTGRTLDKLAEEAL